MGKAAYKSNAADIIAAGESASLSSDQILALLKALPDTAADEPDADDAVMADAAPASDNPDQQPYMSKAKDTLAQMTQGQIKDAVELYMKTAPATSRVPGVETDLPAIKGNSDIQVFSPYKDLSAEDMSYLVDMRSRMAAYTRSNYQPDVKLVRELTVKTQKAIGEGKIDFGKFEDGLQITQRIAGIKTNELDNTGVAAAAGNWVPELWSNQLWKRIRLPNKVAGQFQVVEMPSATYDLPVEDADPTVYFVPETTNDAQLSLASGAAIPDSLVSAGKVQLVAKKLALRVGFSTEMMEDSIIQFIPQLREQAMWSMENAVDYVILNGDTTNSSANINYAGSGPAATDKFLAFNGMRYLALITNTAVAINALGSSPTLALLRQARFTLISSLNNYAIDPSRLFMVCDPYTYGRMLQIDELLSYFNNGRGSTVNDGLLPPNVDGVDTFASTQLALTTSNGKLAASANNFGTILVASKDSWKVGYRRNITASLDYLPYYDGYQLTMTIRLALKNKDTIANAEIYNLAIS